MANPKIKGGTINAVQTEITSADESARKSQAVVETLIQIIIEAADSVQRPG